MIKHLLPSILAVSTGLFSACGAPPGDAKSITSGVTEVRGEDGVLTRTSAGREGYLEDLAYFRGRLQELKASPGGDPKLAESMAEIVSQLEQLKVEPTAAPGQLTIQDCGVSSYSLSANVYPGFASGSATASASYTEFGPPSPWSKTLYTYAKATSYSGITYGNPGPFSGVFSGVGTFSVPTASTQSGIDFCQHLVARAYIYAPGCSGGYVNVYQQMDTCG